MKIQRIHISVNLYDIPSIKGLFGCEDMMWNEAKCAYFENFLL
nr:penicillin-binding protein [uncultured Chryseobacterium sp.]